MYQVDHGWWFVPNPLNKFTVSPRDELKYNADGCLTDRRSQCDADRKPEKKGRLCPA
jgi:hypothetical protein